MQPTVNEEKMIANIGVKFSYLHAASTAKYVGDYILSQSENGFWFIAVVAGADTYHWSSVSLVPRVIGAP